MMTGGVCLSVNVCACAALCSVHNTPPPQVTNKSHPQQFGTLSFDKTDTLGEYLGKKKADAPTKRCLLYTSDAADE